MKIHPKKALGQHFLTDKNIAKKIVHAISLPSNTTIIELGPGTGALTGLLDKRMAVSRGRVIAIELDQRSISYLEGLPLKVTTIRHGDMLKLNFRRLADEIRAPVTIVSNLPYNISGPMLAKLFDQRRYISKAVLMVQKEMAERVAATPGNKQYGVLSVFLQYAYEVERLFAVPRSAFSPRPKVQSMVIRLTKRKEAPLVTVFHAHDSGAAFDVAYFTHMADEALFKKVVRCAFQMRRKKIKNALSPLMRTGKREIQMKELLNSIGISAEKRPEELHVEDFIKISNKLMQHI